MSWSFDPEVPAGYQDADIEMAELREAAREAEVTAAPAAPPRPSRDAAASDREHEGKEMVECEACHEEKPETCGESVVVYTHRIEGRAVGVDTEWVCNDCIEGAEEARTERMVEARRQYYYEK